MSNLLAQDLQIQKCSDASDRDLHFKNVVPIPRGVWGPVCRLVGRALPTVSSLERQLAAFSFPRRSHLAFSNYTIFHIRRAWVLGIN